MRVVLVSHYFPNHFGGVEIFAKDLAVRLVGQGYQITWIASGRPPDDVITGIRFEPVRAFNGMERWFGIPYPIWGPSSIFKLMRLLRHADCVHVHECLYMGSVIAVVLARCFGRPVCITQHIGGVPYQKLLPRFAMALAYRWVGFRVLRLAGRVVFCSDKAKDFFERGLTFKRSPLLIRNGVDLDRFSPPSKEERMRLRECAGISPEDRIILFVGRFVEKKGLALIRALVSRFADCTWVFLGRGPEDPRHWQLANVRVEGTVDQAEVARWYKRADVMVLPSVGEGFPLVIQEAMASGLPVVTTKDTALGQMGVEQWISVAEPTVEGITAALNGVMERLRCHGVDGSLTRRFAREQWSCDEMVKRYSDVFRQLQGS